MKDLDADFKSIVLWEIRECRKEIKTLNQFRWKVAGAYSILCGCISVAFTVVMEIVYHQ